MGGSIAAKGVPVLMASGGGVDIEEVAGSRRRRSSGAVSPSWGCSRIKPRLAFELASRPTSAGGREDHAGRQQSFFGKGRDPE